jgi:hypothetical protein
MLDQEIAQRVSSYQEDIERPDSIPGISTRIGEQILAEICWSLDTMRAQVKGNLADLKREISI